MANDGGELVPDALYEELFQARLSGLTEYAVSKRHGVPVRTVRRAVEALAPKVDNKLRMRELAVELGRLDRLGEVFLEVALTEKDAQAAAIVLKVSERKSSMLGLDYAPLRTDLATLTVIQPPPRADSTALIRQALERVCAEGRPPPQPEPQQPEPAIEGEILEAEPVP
jgi:hypothetical protein